MGNKKQQVVQHPTMSFAQAMGNAQVNAAKEKIFPYIDQKMGQLAQEIFMSVYRVVQKDKEFIMISQMAMEELLKELVPGYTDDTKAEKIAVIEDRILGLEEVTDGAKEKDNVRLEVSQKTSKDTDFGPAQKLAIASLLQQNKEGTVQTYQELENVVVGMQKGETRECLIPEEGDAPENTTLKITVKRISRAKAAPQETKQEAPTNEQASSNQ